MTINISLTPPGFSELVVLSSVDFQTFSSFADDTGTLAKSKSQSKARRRLVGGKTKDWLLDR